MQDKEKNLYIKSGKILGSALKFAQKQVKVGGSLLECAESIEDFIIKEGGKPAFPVNVSIGNIAAHYSPSSASKEVFTKKDVAKIDVGVHIDGYITDSAVTIDLSGEFGKMVEASQKALDAALSVVKPNGSISKVGEVVEKEIKKAGFKPISNLSGHRIEQWIAHASPSVPNISTREDKKFEVGKVYALEPFATNGAGFVHEGVQAEIFGFDENKPTRSMGARKILSFVEEEYNALPFAERWIEKKLKLAEFERKVAFREMLSKNLIHSYPVLKEAEGKTVTQAETTVLIGENDIIKLV